MKRLLLFAALAAVASPASAQVTTAPGGTYAQDFNTLASAGTANAFSDNVTIVGWYASRTTYNAGTGSSATGALYSFGTTADRALGSVVSGTTGTIYYGVRIRNTGTAAVTSLALSYTGEQWRNGGNTSAQKLDVAYKVNAAALDETGYTDVDALDFVSPTVGATAGALDGNDPANRTALSSTINVVVPAGAEIWVRWTDINDAGNDHGLAVDDVAFTAAGAPAGQTAVTQTLDDTAGWRLLAAPVQNVTVGTLAGINLVQSVVGQYPDFPEDNLYLSFGGGGTTGLIAASDMAQPVVPGRGFFWYFFDQDIAVDPGAFGGGTSQSYALPARPLSATGPAVTSDLSQTFNVNGDGSYMVGNPFAQALASTGVTQTAGGGTFQTTVQLYDPATGYVPVDRTTATDLATWQGFFAEVQGATAPVTFTYLAASRTAATPELVGRPVASTQVALALDGQVAVGAATSSVADRAAIVKFSEAGRTGWDIDDASKLTPPGATYALIAVVGELNGAERRQSVRSLPAAQAEAAVDVQFTTTHAGRFELSAREVPTGWGVSVLDRVTGTMTDLTAGPYAFTSDAGDWTGRFSVTITQSRTTAGEASPVAFELSAPAPNPSATEARLALRVDSAQRVTATVVDALGRTVATVFDGALAAGAEQALVVPTARLAPGIYVVRVVGETFAQSRRLTVAR